MAKTRTEKKALIDQYKEVLNDHPNYILVDTNRVSMEDIDTLKEQLSENDGLFLFLKNTLFKIAAADTDQPTQVQELSDSTGMIAFGEDPTGPSKALKDIQDEHEVMDARYGVLFGDVITSDTIKALAEIPSREELLAKLVGSINAPLSGFARILKGNARAFVYTLSEIQKTKGEAAQA